MKKLRIVRGGSLLHAMWSTMAVCLFLGSGLLGYLALMENVTLATSTDKPTHATLLRASVVNPDGTLATASKTANAWWGYSVLLELELPHAPRFADMPGLASAGRDRTLTQVRLRPWPSLRFVADRWRQHFLKSAELQVYSGGPLERELRVREPGQSRGALIPLLCALLGVLCLATSLRYQPDRIVVEKSPPDSHREPATGAVS